MSEPKKTPDEIKKRLYCSLSAYNDRCTMQCNCCEYYTPGYNLTEANKDTLAYIQQLESSYSQVGKALCGKENATLEELLQAASQIKADLEAVKRERDAAVSELPHHCWNCKYHLDKPIEETDDFGRTIYIYCDADCCYPDEENSSWEWRGVCPENTEVQEDG